MAFSLSRKPILSVARTITGSVQPLWPRFSIVRYPEKWGFFMRVQQPVRDRNMSLWQSAVRQALANRGDLSDAEKKQAEYGISLHAQSEQTATPLAAPAPAPQVAGKSALGSAANIA